MGRLIHWRTRVTAHAYPIIGCNVGKQIHLRLVNTGQSWQLSKERSRIH